MKKILTILFILALFFAPRPLHAQEPTNYNEAFLQMNLRMEEYDKAHDEYVLRRSQYLKFKSLQSENDARKATTAMLQARDNVVIAYIVVLEKRMDEAKGITDGDRGLLKGQLDDEIIFFKNHHDRIPSAGTLSDLVKDSDLAKDQYTKDVKDLFYKVLFAISNGKVTDLKSRLNENFGGIKAKVEVIRAETRPEYQFSVTKMQAIDRFIFESENKIQRADEKQLTATTINQAGRQFDFQEYTTRLGVLDEARLLLKDASSYLKEIVSQMKLKEQGT